MIRLGPNIEIGDEVLTFTQVAGGGPGGQHANKTASRVDLRVALAALPLHPEAAARLAALAGDRLTSEGDLLLSCDETRSARQNRALVVDRLRELVLAALVRPKPRRRTRPSRGSVERRLESKRQRGDRLRDRRADD
ncbi:MAG: aminoacyl-tRNA hydrolase [Planctomycetes bacterium]|nr:aminoacyl-tRNA hydrolase [Planctomycetota bacterium]